MTVSRDDLLDAVRAASRRSTGWWRSYCPFCDETNGKRGNDNFSINIGTGKYSCWSCGEFGYLKNISEIFFDPWEFKKVVAQAENPPELPDKIELPREFVRLSSRIGRNSVAYEEARNYVLGRGLDEAVIEEVGIGAVLRGFYRDSVVIPITVAGVCRGWVARQYKQKNYLYPKGMQREEIMFNYDELLLDVEEPIMLVEGVFDALPHWPMAAACLGKPADNHVEILKKVTRPIAIILDADAQHTGWVLAERLKLSGVNASFVRLPPGSDPGNADPDWLWDEVCACFL